MQQTKSSILILINDEHLPPVRGEQKDRLLEQDPERLESWRSFIREQILAIGQQLSCRGNQILLLANKGNPLIQQTKVNELPALEMGGLATLPNRFRLWQWLRKQTFLHFVAVGEDSLPLALKLAKTRKRDACKIYGLFYLPVRKNFKPLSRLDACVYTSSAVLESLKEGVANPVFCLPGIANPEVLNKQAKNEGNFVFGMAESLCNASGALTVVRAMAAIWQIADLPPWEVRMFGNGERFSLILDEAEKLGVSSKLSLLSDQPLQTVAPLCDAWLAPGYSPLETPAALWTGFCANLPTISTNTRLHQLWLPLNESITLSISPENPQALAAAMLEILKEPKKREQLIHRSRNWKKEIDLMAMCQRIQYILSENMPGLPQ